MKIPTNAYPLTWPDGWPKPPTRMRSNFFKSVKKQSTIGSGGFYRTKEGSRSIADARDEVYRQLELLRGVDQRVVISSNLVLRMDGQPHSGQSQPTDPSVAVYFTRKGKPYVLACGKWDKAQDNLWAVAKHVEAMRGQERWGVGSIEQAFRGYMAIPEKTGGVNWWEVLGIAMNATEEQVRDAYATLAKKYHPDGTAPHNELFLAVTEAYKMATGHKVQ